MKHRIGEHKNGEEIQHQGKTYVLMNPDRFCRCVERTTHYLLLYYHDILCDFIKLDERDEYNDCKKIKVRMSTPDEEYGGYCEEPENSADEDNYHFDVFYMYLHSIPHMLKQNLSIFYPENQISLFY